MLNFIFGQNDAGYKCDLFAKHSDTIKLETLIVLMNTADALDKLLNKRKSYKFISYFLEPHLATASDSAGTYE
jgi:hypothetical protein